MTCESVDLAACPFCNTTPISADDGTDRFIHPREGNCPLEGEMFHLHEWNRRPPHPVPTATPGGMTGELREPGIALINEWSYWMTGKKSSQQDLNNAVDKFRDTFWKLLPPTPEA